VFRPRVFLVFALLQLNMACLHYERTDTVRREENPQAISFESEAAERLFADALEKKKVSNLDISSANITVPLIFYWSKSVRLSEAAFFNDQVKACDVDGNGLLSDTEVAEYHKNVTGKDDPLKVYRQILEQEGDVKITPSRKTYDVHFEQTFLGKPELALSHEAARYAGVEPSESGFRITFQEAPRPFTLHWQARGRPFVPHGSIKVGFGFGEWDDEAE
jgi:hypothetical protein